MTDDAFTTALEQANPVTALAVLEQQGVLSVRGLRLPAGVSYERYESLGAVVRVWDDMRKWVIGDWLLYGIKNFGEESFQASEVLGLSVRSRQQYLRVAEAFPWTRRRFEPPVTWSHHRSLLAEEPLEADRWLQLAIDHRWTRDEMVEARKGNDTQPDPFPRQQIVEVVLTAAERVWTEATPASQRVVREDDWLVPGYVMNDLKRALGVEDEEDDDAS